MTVPTPDRATEYARLIGRAQAIFEECHTLLIGPGSAALPKERRRAMLAMIADWQSEVNALFEAMK